MDTLPPPRPGRLQRRQRRPLTPLPLRDVLKISDWRTRSDGSHRNSSAIFQPRRTAYAANLPPDDRALCPACMGTGAWGNPAEIGACSGCRHMFASDAFPGDDRGYCDGHRCRTCAGAGVVCPHCSGMRFVRVPRPAGNEVSRCPTCCEGNNVSLSKEMAAIRAWLVRRCPSCGSVRQRGQARCEACGVVTAIGAVS